MNDIVDKKANDKELYAKMYEAVRPYVRQADITNQNDNSLEFDFIDPIHGRLELRMYAHEGAAVLTTWSNRSVFNGGSLAYHHNAFSKPDILADWVKVVIGYLTDPFKHYEAPMLEEWRSIENSLCSFVGKYGALTLTSKILNVPYFSDDERIKLLSYLGLTQSIKTAQEREATWELAKNAAKTTKEKL